MELFNESLEGKIHAHKLYNLLLEQIPNIYEKKKERIFRGHLRQKIWNCEKREILLQCTRLDLAGRVLWSTW
mgnify:CR=1 FL=1